MLEQEILHRRGSPENPLKQADIVYKFRNVARACLAARRLERVIELAAMLDELSDTSELIATLGAPAGSE